jgi:hypothetical protein
LSCLGIENPPEAEQWYCIDCAVLVNDVNIS